MSKVNHNQNNQAYLIQCDAEGAKFSQVSDVKLSFEGTNWLSRLALRFGFWLSNEFLSSRCVAKDIGTFKPFLSNAWENMYEKFQDLKKANPFTCFMFACRMAHSFDKASSGRMSISTNDASLCADESNSRPSGHSNVCEYLSKNNALPPEAAPCVDFNVSEQDNRRVLKMYINRNGEVKVNLKGEWCLNGDRMEKFVPTRNVTISDDDSSKGVSRKKGFEQLTITGEYCDEFDNNTWKHFSCEASKEDVFFWQDVNNSLSQLAKGETIDLSELVKSIPESENQENVINATPQGESSENEIQLKVDYLDDKVSLSRIDGEKKIPLNNPKISQGSDPKHVIITAQDNAQQRSFVVELSDLLKMESWNSSGCFDKENCILDSGEWISLGEYLEKKGISLEGKEKVVQVYGNGGSESGDWTLKITKKHCSISSKSGQRYEGASVTMGQNGEYSYMEIQKIPDDDEYVRIGLNGQSTPFKVKLADLLSEDGWVKQKKK